MVLAMSRMAGLSPAEMPPSLTKMLSGIPAHVPGVMVCGAVTTTAGLPVLPGMRHRDDPSRRGR